MIKESKEITIMGYKFQVVWNSELSDTDVQGEISFRKLKISLCASLENVRQRAKNTLLHELIEGVLEYCQIKMDHTDLTRLTNALFAVLSDNGMENLEVGLPGYAASIPYSCRSDNKPKIAIGDPLYPSVDPELREWALRAGDTKHA